jgi:pimeloyl-ACP methyl ester carboxylesterase
MTDGAGWVEVAGGRLPFEVAGSGTGVALLHAGIADMRQWDPQWAELAARHRVVRYDLRGFGRADVVDTAFSNRADLVAVLDAAGLDRAVLVGCSRAGSIALDTTLEFPDRVSGLVWVCGGVSGDDGEETPDEVAAGQREEALSEAKDWAALAEFDVAIWVDGLGQPAGRAPTEAREAVRRMTYDTYVQEKPYGDTIVLDPPAIGRLGEVRVPTLVMIGELDTPSTRRAADIVASGAPGARRIDLPDVAHLPNLERPDWFTETLLGFLAEVDAGS